MKKPGRTRRACAAPRCAGSCARAAQRAALRVYRFEPLEVRRLLSTAGISGLPEWSSASLPELGNGNTIIPDQNSAVSGAVNALAPDPTNANRLFVSTVNGGVWRTSDALDTDPYNEGKPAWAPLTDLYPSLSFGTIVFDPTDPTNNTLWAGLALTSNGGNDGETTTGLLKTTDGGKTWVPMATGTAAVAPPGGLGKQNIQSIVPTTQIDPTTKKQVILVGTSNGGVWRSNDGGVTFTDMSATGAGGLPASVSANVSQLIVDPGNPNQFYVAMPGVGIYRSTGNQGASWVAVNTGLVTAAGAAGVGGSLNIKLSVYNSGGINAVYAAVVYPAPPPPPGGPNATIPSLVFRSTNAGGNWVQLGPSVNVQPGNNQSNNYALVEDRNNANSVYLAGDSQPTGPFDANIVHYNPSTNKWDSVVDGGANNTSPHADSRDLQWDANGNLLFASDGGFYRMINVGTSSQKWQAPIGNLEAHEIYSVGYIPGAGFVFGNQDTGTAEPQIPTAQQSTFTYQDITSGDGNTVAVDSTSKPGTVYVYSSGNALLAFNLQTFNTLYQLQSTARVALNVIGSNPAVQVTTKNAAGNPFDPTVPFVPPYLLNAVNPTSMLLGTNYLYESTDQGKDVTLLNGPLVNNLPDPTKTVGNILPLIYGGTANGTPNASVIYAATGSGGSSVSPATGLTTLLVRTSGTGMPTAATTPAGITGIRAAAADPANYNTAFIVDSNGHVYRTTDAGATAGNWTDVTGDLGTLATDLRCAVVLDIGGKQYLMVGGADGVYFTNTAGPTFHWRKFGNLLPGVIAKDMHYDPGRDMVYVGTWGRGVWAVSQVSKFFNSTVTTLNITGDQDQLNENDTFTLALDPNIPNVLDVSIDNSFKHIKYQVQTTCLDQINISGGGGTDVYNILGIPAGVPLTINTGTATATVHFSNTANPSGLVGSINGPVNITGASGTTVLQIDNSGDGNSNETANVAVTTGAGTITGLSGSPITYDAKAGVTAVALTTSSGGGDQVNLTSVGVPVDVTDPSAASTFRGDFIDVGHMGSTANITAQITVRCANNFDSINVEDNVQLGTIPIVVDQDAPAGDVMFARFTGASPAPIRFQFSSLDRANIATGIDGNAVDVYGPGDVMGTKRVTVQNQPGVTVQGIVLPGGLVATNASNLLVKQAFLGDTTIIGGSNSTLDSNQITNLTVNGGATGLMVSNNTIGGTVGVSANSSNATLTGNTVSGPVTATGVSGIKLIQNNLSTLALSNTIGATATNNTLSGGATVDGGSGADLDTNTMASLTLTGGTANVVVNNNSIIGALTINGGGATNVTITNNRAGSFDNETAADGTITGNDFGWTPPPPPGAFHRAAAGLVPITFNLDARFTGNIQNNNVHNGQIGVNELTPASLIGNRIYGNAVGVVAPINDTVNGFGFFSGSGANDIYNNVTGVNLTGRMQLQHIYSNTTGVIGSGTLGGNSLDTANIIEMNTTAVDFAGTIQFNRIDKNVTAILTHNAQVIVHNLIYRNTGAGVRTNGATGVRVVNNTFYTTAGNNVQVDGKSTGVELLNNIFEADGGGYDMYVADDSRSGFFSDYNDLYSTGAGLLYHYISDYGDILDVQRDIDSLDLHSIGTSAVNPGYAAPRFANAATDNFQVAAPTGGLHASSPTIDAADPATDLLLPSAYHNLLANPSFESGTASWNVNVGGTTQSGSPPAFDGTSYFYSGAVGAGFAEQVVSLTGAGFTAQQLDAQNLALVFGGRVRSAAETPADQGKLILTFLDGSGNPLGAPDTVPASNVSDRWELVGDRVHVPIGARSVKYRFESVRESGATDDSYLDDAALYVLPDSVAPDQGAYGDTDAGEINTATAHIQLITPQLYVDWQPNQSHTIAWTTFDGGGSAVRIDVYQDVNGTPQFLTNVTPSTPDTGSYAWIPQNSGLTYGTFGLRIRVSLVNASSAVDQSSEAWAIPQNTHVYYVNDGSTVGDQYTTAPGSNRNTGRTPASPKPLLSVLLADYALGPGDTVYVDNGIYAHAGPIVLSGNPAIGNGQGVTIVGPTNAGTAALITAPATGPVFDINAGNFVTLSHLSLSGGQYGVWVRGGSSNFTGSFLTTSGNALDGVRLEADSSSSALLDHIVSSGNSRDGISVAGPGVALTNSTSHDNAGAGVTFQNAGNAVLTDNESYNNQAGLLIVNQQIPGTVAIVGGTDLSKGLGNRFHDDAQFGVNATGSVAVVGNSVYNITGAGAIGINVVQGATAAENVVSASKTGIFSSGGALTNNRVFNSTGTGIDATNSSNATGNVSYSNAVGLEGDGSPDWSNNLVYANSVAGIWLHSGFSASIFNNTVYQSAGDAVRIESSGNNFGFQHVNVRNNILWTQAGYDLTVTPQAEIGFQSDYNDLYVSGSGKVGLWENVARPGLSDWRLASFTDASSLSADPKFVNPAGGDGVLGYSGGADHGSDDDFHEQSLAGSFHGGSLAPTLSANTGLPIASSGTLAPDAANSPAVDRGDPASSFANEPSPNGGFINLGAYGNTAQASESQIPYVLVLAPNGGETLVEGQTATILWRSEDMSGAANIDLLSNGAVVANIATNVPNSGQYSWKIPATIAPGGNYVVRVTRIGPPPATGVSSAPFSIAGATHTFYVNDATVQPGDFTTAAGNDANSGLDPAHPKASIRALLQAYNLGAGDVIEVDEGTYTLSNNIVIAAARSGVTIRGFFDPANPTHVAVLNRNSTTVGTDVFDLQGATNVTLDHLSITGGDVGVNASDNAASTGLTVSNCDVYGNYDYNIYLGATNGGAVITGSRIHDTSGSYNIGIYSSQDTITVSNNLIYNNARIGVQVSTNSTVSGNVAYNNGVGIQADSSTITGNIVHDNANAGIAVSGNSTVSGNTAYHNVGANTYPEAGIEVSGGTVQGNVVYGNSVGILVPGGGAITDNLIYGNAADGISSGSGAAITGNVVHDNGAWGLQSNVYFGSPASFTNNLIYNNVSGGLQLTGGYFTPITNNTIYQPTGDAFALVSAQNQSNISLRNNTLWVASGYDVRTDANSQATLTSDFNDLYATGTGRVGLWQNVDRTGLSDWQLASLQDANSLSADPLFVNTAGGDFHEQSLYGSFHGGSLAPVLNTTTGLPAPAMATLAKDAAQSPTIDRGDPASPYANEPAPNGGYVNLGAFGNTAQASESPSSYVLVTRPNGRENWIAGQTFTISWRTDNPGVGLADIDLLHRAANGTLTLQANIATAVANSGTYQWSIPSSVPAAGDYVIRITREGTPATSDLSDVTFSIAAATHVYYINDSTVQPGDWTTAPGNDANSGVDPAHPKASILGVLSAYTLGPGDTIMVDEGTYNLTGDIVLTAAASGITIEGYNNPSFSTYKAVLNRGNKSGGADFIFNGAQSVTLDHLSLTGASYGVTDNYNVQNSHVTVSNCEIFGNDAFASGYAVYIIGGADNFSLTNCNIHDNDQGVEVDGSSNVTITNNTIFNARGRGISVNARGPAAISGNEVYNITGVAITAYGSLGSLVTVANNRSHDSGGDLIVGSYALATANTLYNQIGTGGSAVQVSGGEARGNVVYNAYNGIVVNSGLADQNRVYDCSNDGMFVSGGATASNNQVYSDAVGIQGDYSPIISGNLVYANTVRGIWLSDGHADQVFGNTVYQPAGDAIDIVSNEFNFQSQQIQVRNNILWASAGYDLNLSDDAGIGFVSDYNDLVVTGTGKAARVATQDYPALSDWVYEYGFDAHSISADPMFVNVNGPDGMLGFTGGVDHGADDNFHLQPASPAIDAGDPNSNYFNEPAPNGGRINLGNFGNTPQADPSAASQLVQITSPTNLQKLEAGHSYTLSWQTAGVVANQPVLLIDAGGPAVGRWTADQFSTIGGFAKTVANPIDTSGVVNPAPQQVYQSYVFADASPELAYQLPVPDGAYTLRLHFMDDVSYLGKPVFDIKVNGVVVKAAYDLFADAGAGYRATSLSFNVAATGGKGLLVELVDVSGPAVLSAIELTAANPNPVPTPTATLQVSTDAGATWSTIATDQSLDAQGRGSFQWTPTATTAGPTALFRVSIDHTAVSGVSQPFAIYNGGTDYYVNDASTAGDSLTTAVGNNANSGKSPSSPLADIQAVLAEYNPGAGDVIHVDAGTYSLVHNMTLTAANAGLVIRGPATSAEAVLNRGNVGEYVFDFTAGANNITLDHLAMTGGSVAVNAGYSVGATGDTVSNDDIYGNVDYGISIAGSGNVGWTVTNTRLHDQIGGYGHRGTGVLSNSPITITNNTAFNNPGTGIDVEGNTSGSVVSANTVYANSTGVYAEHSTVSNNVAHDNSVAGIEGGVGSVLTGNLAYRQTAAAAAGILLLGAEARGNVAYDNYNGIVGAYSYFGGAALIDRNRVYSNINFGILVSGSTSQVFDNLDYANSVAGLVVTGNAGLMITDNTIYQIVGDAVRLTTSPNAAVRGNILWVQAGDDLDISADSQSGFVSDYNDLYPGTAGGAGHVGFFNGAAQNQLSDWQAASGQDAHSISADPMFVSVKGADQVLGYSAAGVGYDGGQDDDFYLAAGSPAIDRGYTWGPLTDLLYQPRADDPGTPNAGSPGYAPADQGASLYSLTGTPQNWRGISSNFNYTLPFSFPFYDGSFTSVQVSSSGFLQFAGSDSPGDTVNSDAKLLLDRRIAPFWAAIRTDQSGSDIYLDTSIANQVKFTWKATDFAGTSPVNFSIVLFSDGRIRFDYGAGNAGFSPTVGISMGDGQHATFLSDDGAASLANANSVLFGFQPGIADMGAYEFEGSSLDKTAPTVIATAPAALQTGGPIAPLSQIGLAFSKPLNVIDALAPGNYQLLGAGPDGMFGTADDVLYPLTPQYAGGGSTMVTLALANGSLAPGLYRLTAISAPGAGLHDLSGNPLAGDGTHPGTSYIVAFTVAQTTATLVSTTLSDGSTAASQTQRSEVRQITIKVSSAVQLSASNFALSLLNTGGSGKNDGSAPTALSGVIASAISTDGGITWVLTFNKNVAGATDATGSLVDGIYTVTVNSPSVTGSNLTTAFHRLFGDINGDKTVSNTDYFQFRKAFNTSAGQAGFNADFDFSGGGTINNADYFQFRKRFLKQFVY